MNNSTSARLSLFFNTDSGKTEESTYFPLLLLLNNRGNTSPTTIPAGNPMTTAPKIRLSGGVTGVEGPVGVDVGGVVVGGVVIGGI